MSPIYEPHILVILKMDNKRCVYKMIDDDDDDDDDDRPIIGKITYLCICIYIYTYGGFHKWWHPKTSI